MTISNSAAVRLYGKCVFVKIREVSFDNSRYDSSLGEFVFTYMIRDPCSVLIQEQK